MIIDDFFELEKQIYTIELEEHVKDKSNKLPQLRIICETNGDIGSYCIIWVEKGFFIGEIKEDNIINCWAFFKHIEEAIAAL